MADVRIFVTDMDGTVLDTWERELADVNLDPRPGDGLLARLAIRDLAADINGGIE